MKVVNDLLNYNGMKIVQNNEYFNFSLDSVLLPNFVTLNKGIKKILDLGTGNAPIPLILSTLTNAELYGIELQKEVYDLAIESVKINSLTDRITIINDNMKNLENYFLLNSFDVIVSNPPYFRVDESSNVNENIQKTIARHEISCTLEDIIIESGSNLNPIVKCIGSNNYTLQVGLFKNKTSAETLLYTIQQNHLPGRIVQEY